MKPYEIKRPDLCAVTCLERIQAFMQEEVKDGERWPGCIHMRDRVNELIEDMLREPETDQSLPLVGTVNAERVEFVDEPADDTEGEPIDWTIVATGPDGSVLCQSPTGARKRYWFSGYEAPKPEASE